MMRGQKEKALRGNGELNKNSTVLIIAQKGLL